MTRQFVHLDISAISLKRHLRRDVGDLATLENSVRKIGLLHPVIVDRQNVLISGERRLEACRRAGLSTVPVLKLDVAFDSMMALDIQSDENLCRQPLSSEELDAHILAKKSSLGKLSASPGRRFIDRLKALFGGGR
jgi:ParB family chromosome partitioning protein